jgi:hypothetical protein
MLSVASLITTPARIWRRESLLLSSLAEGNPHLSARCPSRRNGRRRRSVVPLDGRSFDLNDPIIMADYIFELLAVSAEPSLAWV